MTRPSIFPDIAKAVTSLKRDRLMVVSGTFMPDVEIDDEYILEQLRSAEATIERQLRCFLTPTEIRPPGTPDTELAALAAAGARVVEEPGYDYEAERYQGGEWGYMTLRHRPVIEIHSIQFAYPAQTSRLFTYPKEWIRLDRRYGRLSIVPANSAIFTAMDGYVMSALGGGRDIPLMIQVSYSAGLRNAEDLYPDLLSLIKRLAVLNIVEDQFIPSSGSTSADGLSQSLSWDPNAAREAIDKKVEVIRQHIAGIRMIGM